MTTSNADELVVPRFVQRFPEHGKSIIELRFRDSAVNELCHDYDDVLNALGDGRVGSGEHGGGGALEDLRRLKEELELELLQRLSRYTSAKPRG